MIKHIFTNSFGILISRILGFLRDLLTASILGANIYSDIFFVAFKLPNLFRRIFAEGAFTQVFIPSYSRSKQKIQFSTIIFLQFLAFILLLSIFVTIFASLITKVIAVGFDSATIELASPLVAICFYYLPLVFIVTFLAALLQYKHHFATTAFSTSLLNISMITALLISSNLEKYEIVYYLTWGVIIGGILQVIAHLIAIKRLRIRFFTTYLRKSRNNIKRSNFYKQFYPAVFGSSSAHLAAFLDTWLASFLVSGTISYLYYANRVFQLPLALFAIATSVALFPTIAKAIKNNDEQKALNYLRKAFYILFSLLFLASFIGIVFNEFIVELLFQRGAFTQIDTQNTAIILTMYLIGLLPFGIAKIFSLWLYAKELQLKAAKITAISLGWNIVFSLILIIPYEAVGLAFASTLSGFIVLHLTLKEFGYNKFLQLLK
ncbi:MAG: murein biosynthesis integral membrane protein MurJ [Arcobacteraceae bacterium]|nr:murein biosynthesis integral membrane protein MurJ [Arcobacteraceae bacterium]